MTVPGSYIPYALGGLGHGRYRNALTQAYGNSLAQSNSAYTGADIAQQPGKTESAAAAKPIEDAGIRAGEIIAWRAWRFGSGGLLYGMFVDVAWIPGEAMTGDPSITSFRRRLHGVHAFKTLNQTVGQYGREAKVAIGRVELWGTVIEHEYGYRAEFGKIVSLDAIFDRDSRTPGDRDKILDDLRKRYSVHESSENQSSITGSE